MNAPLPQFSIALDLLSEGRAQVHSAEVRVFGPQGLIGKGRVESFTDGRGILSLSNVAVSYGKHRVEIDFLDRNGKSLDRMLIERQRPRRPGSARNSAYTTSLSHPGNL